MNQAVTGAGPQIELAGIERVFHLGDSAVHALAGIELAIDAGEYLSVMGPSGSGKSAAEQARVRSLRIGFVFQSFHLVPRLTAAENIALPMMLAGISPAERAPRVDKALADFGLADRANHRPDELSGGQRQRVAIARATVMQPAMLLADEPTGNLDRATGEEVMRLLEELHERGVTLIMVTHDQALGDRAHRRIYMEDGAIRRDSGRDAGPVT